MQVIGHRGAACIAPENTWVSFEAALVRGLDAIETDVRATSDGKLILIHDKRLERTTDGAGLVEGTPWSVVKELDAGSWFEGKYAHARVPTLESTLERYGGRAHFVLEMKGRGTELESLEIVRRLQLLDRVTFTSFHFDRLLAIKRKRPESRVGFLSADRSDATVVRTLDAGFNQFCPSARDANTARVRRWRELGVEVRVWGVKNREMAIAAREAGVDGMTVAHPGWLRS